LFHEDARRANTPVGWTIHGRAYKQRPHLVEVDSLSELNEGYTQGLLERIDFKAPVFALVAGDPSLRPRFTRAATQNCQCNTPWNERNLRERQPWVAYQLPPASASAGVDCHINSGAPAGPSVPSPVSTEPAQRATQQSDGVQEKRCPHHDDLVIWTPDDEAEVSSGEGEVQDTGSESETMELQEEPEEKEEDEHGRESGSEAVESLDVDPLESGEGCPPTPPHRQVEDGETPEEKAPRARRKLNDGSADAWEYDCFPAWGDVLGDDSSDDCVSEGLYCNESEDR
jgi:hypothetical protein